MNTLLVFLDILAWAWAAFVAAALAVMVPLNFMADMKWQRDAAFRREWDVKMKATVERPGHAAGKALVVGPARMFPAVAWLVARWWTA